MTEPKELGNRWAHSRYSSGIYHARLKNFKDPTRDIQIELEADSSGAVYATYRFGGELIEINEGNGMANFQEASEHALKRIQKMFHDRNKANLVLEFLPFDSINDIKRAFGVAKSTASTWTGYNSPKPRQIMARRFINQALVIMGFRFSGRGKGEFVALGEPAWEEEEPNAK